MVTKNTWIKGLNSDISKLKTANETYLDALNMTIITQDGDSSYALQSTKGTERGFVLPTPGPTYKFDFSGRTGSCSFIFTISGIGTLTFAITNIEDKSPEDIAAIFNEEILTLYPSGTPDVKAFYNNNYVVIYDYSTLLTITLASNCFNERWTYVGGQYIMGWGYSDNELILISGDVNVDIENPEDFNNVTISRNGSVGCIWRIPLDNATGEAIKPDGTRVALGSTLEAKEFLVYKELLNLSRYYNIYKSVKCRKESSLIFRVVFTDFYNDIRTLNVLEDQIQATPVELINILPVHKPQQPVITKVIPGGFLPTGRYQVWYQLSSFQGALSTVSPLSSIITIGDQSDLSEYSGAVVGTVSTKSIELQINNLDTNYDLVRFGYTVYQVEGLAESFYFDEIVIPTSGSITTVLNGTEENIPISDQVQLSNANRPPSVAKTLDVVKNKLLIANTRTRLFDVDFDSRVYRFNASRSAALYNNGDAYLSPKVSINYAGSFINVNGVISALTYNNLITLINDEFDLINPFNDENPANPLNDSDWLANSQFKFQSNGTVLGGTGPNISYEFVTKEAIENTNQFTVKNSPSVTPVYSTGESYDFGTYVQPIPDSFRNMRSPYYDSVFWSYARGEVYRFAIVFRDLYGFPTFAKWIGDIKFPFVNDNDLGIASVLSNLSSSAELSTNQLGIKFTLDTDSEQFQAIKDKISGWEFVRVERTVENKTKLGVGLLENVDQQNSAILGVVRTTPLALANSVGIDSTYQLLFNPSFLKNIDNQFINGDYIKLLGTYVQDSEGIPNTSSISVARIYSSSETIGESSTSKRDITFKWSVNKSNSQNYIPADPSNGLTFPYISMSGVDGDVSIDQYSSATNKLDLLTLTTSLSRVSTTGFNKRMVSYERYINEQYGGFTRNARYNNTYISTGHFQPYEINQVISPSIVFGGDCVIALFPYQASEINIKDDSGWNKATITARVAIFFPAECHGFNPYFMVYDEPFTSQRTNNRLSDDPIYEEDIPVNTAYNQQMNTTIYLSAPIRFNNLKEESYTIYASPNKIDGELIDSWRNFRTNEFIAVNGNYGEINRIIELKDKLYFYQTGAIGIAAIDERVLVNDGDSSQTQLGSGGTLPRYDYLSTETGVIHQFAVEKSGSGIYHYDALLNKAFKLAQGVTPISDIKGLIGKFNNFDPSIKTGDQLFTDQPKSVHIAFDSRVNRIYFTLLGEDEQLTVSYNELIDAFESRHSFTPEMYLNMRNFFISLDPNALNTTVELHNIGRYGTYYGAVRPSTVKFRNNLDSPDLVKVFDNVWINSEVSDNGTLVNESITTLQATNDYQDTGVLTTLNKIKPLLRTWRWNSLRNNSDKRRMYDKYIDIELTYTPQGTLPNKKFILHDVVLENSMRSTIKPK
jgi:hypothetical protein